MRSGIIPGFYSGTSNLVLPLPKYQFPQEFENASRLTYYATFFNSLEVNSTFYKLPLARTIESWKQQVPPGFKFTFKLWREITHTSDLAFRKKDVERFFSIIDHAVPNSGCVLLQLPPSTGFSCLKHLELLLAGIATGPGTNWPLAVEFRNRSWYQDETYALLRSYHPALVLHDIPKSRTPVLNLNPDFAFLRFHGPKGDYRGSYDDSALTEHAVLIREWLSEKKSVYAYFNNTIGDAFNDLRSLNKILQVSDR